MTRRLLQLARTATWVALSSLCLSAPATATAQCAIQVSDVDKILQKYACVSGPLCSGTPRYFLIGVGYVMGKMPSLKGNGFYVSECLRQSDAALPARLSARELSDFRLGRLAAEHDVIPSMMQIADPFDPRAVWAEIWSLIDAARAASRHALGPLSAAETALVGNWDTKDAHQIGHRSNDPNPRVKLQLSADRTFCYSGILYDTLLSGDWHIDKNDQLCLVHSDGQPQLNGCYDFHIGPNSLQLPLMPFNGDLSFLAFPTNPPFLDCNLSP